MRYLFDTNTVIYYLNGSLPTAALTRLNTIVDSDPIISVVTKMETLGFDFKIIEEQEVMETFINGSTVLPIDDNIVDKTIEIRKRKKMKLPDAIIAATALIHNLVIISRNTSDFKSIAGLSVIDPHSW